MTTANHSTAPSAEPQATAPVGAPLFSPRERETLQRTFAENGFVILRDVVSKEKLAELNAKVQDEFERLNRSGSLATIGGMVTGHLNCFPGVAAKPICETLEERGIVDLLRSFIRRSLTTPLIGLNLNLPGSVIQHYHADSQFTEEFMIANIATVDTDLTNGAIEVVPGSHKESHPYWRFVVEGMARRGVRLPLERGDVLLRTSNLWHRGMPNRSATPRPMATFSYLAKSTEEQPPDPFELNGGKVMFNENWYSSDRLGRLRERVFVASPGTFAAYRFVSSLIGKKGYSTP
jgi:hypothetical protein